MRLLLPLALALGCGRADCPKAVGHGMDLATAELERTLAEESAEWRQRARDEARKMREDAQAACRDQTMTREAYRCTMAAKTYEELIRCPGWR